MKILIDGKDGCLCDACSLEHGCNLSEILVITPVKKFTVKLKGNQTANSVIADAYAKEKCVICGDVLFSEWI